MTIQLNLVPENLRKKKRGALSPLKSFQLPREVVIGLVGGLMALLVFVHVALQVVIIFQYVQLQRFHHLQAVLAPQKAHAGQILQQLRKLQASQQLINDISNNRGVYWTPKLNAVSDSMGRGVWLDRWSVEGKKLTLTGSAVSRTASEMLEVNNFTMKLKSNALFAKDFSKIEPGSMKTRKINTTSIADFTITATLK